MLFAGLVEQGQPLAALAPGGPGEFEAMPVASRCIGLPVQPQQVGDKFLLWIVGTGGGQQGQQIMQIRQRDQRSLARSGGSPRRVFSARRALVEREEPIEEPASVEPIGALLQRF